VFVLTHNAPDDEEDPTVKFLSGDIRSAIGVAREAARGKDVMLLGADVARAGHITDLRFRVAAPHGS
jgi:hypothetical protein